MSNDSSAIDFRTILQSDLLASVVVFLVALPLCMGIAIASGAPPAAGLVTGIVGGLVVGFIAGAPLQVSGPAAGLSVARGIAMVSYRTHTAYDRKFGRERQKQKSAANDDENLFAVESYIRHQGLKFRDRFDPASYVALTKQMDSHDVAAGRGEYFEVRLLLLLSLVIIAATTDFVHVFVFGVASWGHNTVDFVLLCVLFQV